MNSITFKNCTFLYLFNLHFDFTDGLNICIKDLYLATLRILKEYF